METFQCHTQAPSESLLGNLCRQIAWVDGQCQLLQGMIQRCVDVPLLQRLQADLVEMKPEQESWTNWAGPQPWIKCQIS